MTSRLLGVLLFLSVLCSLTPAWANPTLVQIVSVGNANITGNSAVLTMQFPEPSQAGNFLGLFIYGNSGAITLGATSCGDNVNGATSWTQDLTTTGTNNNFYFYHFANSLAGATKVTCTWSAAANTFVTFTLFEYFNVNTATPLTSSQKNEITVAGTSWSGGTLGTTPGANDVVILNCNNTSAGVFSNTTGFTAGTSMALLTANQQEGMVTEVGTGAITAPTVTSPKSATAACQVVALKNATAGADNTNKPRVKRAQMVAYGNGPANVTNPNYQFPCEGTLEVATISIGNTNVATTAFTSSSASYTNINNSPSANGVGGTVQMLHADNFTCSATNNGTITTGTTVIGNSGFTVWMLDIVGATTTTPLDTTTIVAHATNAGTVQGSVGDASNGTTATTTPFKFGSLAGTSAELCVHYWDHNSGSDTGVSGSTGTANFLEPYFGQDGSSGGGWTMDSGLTTIRISGNVASQLTYTRSATGSSNWESVGACFLPLAGGGGGSGIPTPEPANITPRVIIIGTGDINEYLGQTRGLEDDWAWSRHDPRAHVLLSGPYQRLLNSAGHRRDCHGAGTCRVGSDLPLFTDARR